jgi:hypothetical protein
MDVWFGVDMGFGVRVVFGLRLIVMGLELGEGFLQFVDFFLHGLFLLSDTFELVEGVVVDGLELLFVLVFVLFDFLLQFLFFFLQLGDCL